MGEIGLTRREYLYECRFIDLLMIQRGYFRRYHPMWEMTRIIAYQVHFCMGLKEGTTAPTLQEFMTFPWERTDDGESPVDTMTDEDIENLRQLMREENARAAEAKLAKANF